MQQAARKRLGQEREIEARYNEELGEIELFEFREVVEEVSDPDAQILLADARASTTPRRSSATRSASRSTPRASGASSPRPPSR